MASPRSPTRRSDSVRAELDIGVARGHALALVEGVELILIAVLALADAIGFGKIEGRVVVPTPPRHGADAVALPNLRVRDQSSAFLAHRPAPCCLVQARYGEWG